MPETAKKQRGRPFPAGVSGNPDGRPPKGYSITEMMKEMLANKPEVKKAIGESIAKKAMEGDQTAIKTLWAYMDGMPATSPEDPGSPDNPIHHEHRVIWE